MKCEEKCPDDLTLRHALMCSKCAKAIEYGLCRKWSQVDRLGLKFARAPETAGSAISLGEALRQLDKKLGV